MMKPLAAAIALALSGVALADDGQFDWLTFSGFGTLGATMTDDPAIGFRTPYQKNYKADKWSTEVDSRVAGQLDFNRGGTISGVIQVMGIQRNQGEFRADVEWANVAWQINDKWRVRAGRMVTPVFLQSDYQYVGYSLIPARYTWEMAGNYPLSRHDGAEVLFNTELGSGQLQVQGFAGTTRYKTSSLEYKADLVAGAAVTYSTGPFTLRGSATTVDLKVVGSGANTLMTLANLGNPAFAPICPNCASEADKLKAIVDGAGGTFFGLGGTYDDGNWYVQAEYGLRKAEAVVPDTSGYMVLGAYRIKRFTPYLGYSAYATDSNNQAVIAIPAGAPAQFAALATGYNTLLESFATDRSVLTIGARWDFYRNVALKLQAEFVEHDYPQRALGGSWPRNGLPYDGKTNLYTATLDFVF